MAELQSGTENQHHLNGVVSTSETATIGSKRQRRPNVRLGEIGGDQLYDSHPRAIRTKPHNNPSAQIPNKPSKIKPLTNLTTTTTNTNETLDEDDEEDEDDDDVDPINSNANHLDTVIGSWRVKDSKKRGAAPPKRVRTNWVVSSANNETRNDEFNRDFNVENSESLDRSLAENLGGADGSNEREREREFGYHYLNRRSMSNDNDCGEGGGREDAVKIWLRSIGLSRYAPVFEIHEVDDEVLPMLTLEDLKDMGINAVGSRRKMFCAIQKLGKGFS